MARRKKMKKIVGLLAMAVVLLPVLGFSDGAFSFRLGYFVPQAKSDLWDIEFQNMSFRKSSFNSATFGISYEYFMTREVSLVFGADFYSRSRVGFYRDYVGVTIDNFDYAFPAADFVGDFDIVHSFGTSIVPLQASIKLTPFGRRAGLIPYVGGGVSLYIWSVHLNGDMVDFTDQYVYTDTDGSEFDVFGLVRSDARQDSKLAVGWHAFAGFMIPIARRTALEAEFRYSYGKGKLTDAFQGFNNFDLGGYQVSLGINYWF
jgi:opacity protein-like surface antigen